MLSSVKGGESPPPQNNNNQKSEKSGISSPARYEDSQTMTAPLGLNFFHNDSDSSPIHPPPAARLQSSRESHAYDASLIPRGLLSSSAVDVFQKELIPLCHKIDFHLKSERGISLSEIDLIIPGRSLTIVQAAMETIWPQNSIITFPLSNFHQFNPYSTPNQMEPIVHQHLSSFLNTIKIGNKPIVVLDYASSGFSVVNVALYIQDWLANKNIDTRVIAFGLGEMRKVDLSELVEYITYDPPITIKSYFTWEGFDRVSSNIKYDLANPPQDYLKALDHQYDVYCNFKGFVQSRIISGHPEHNAVSQTQRSYDEESYDSQDWSEVGSVDSNDINLTFKDE